MAVKAPPKKPRVAPKPVAARTTGQERTAKTMPGDEQPADIRASAPGDESRADATSKAKVAQPMQGSARTPMTPKATNADTSDTSDNADATKDGGDGADKKKKSTDPVSSEVVTKDVANLNSNIEHSNQDLSTQIKDLSGRTAVLEQNYASTQADIDELEGNADYASTTTSSGVSGLLSGFSTTTWIIIAAAVAAGVYFWQRARKGDQQQVEAVAPPGPPAGAYY